MDPRFLSFSLLGIALCAFLSVMVWSRERRREREAYYRSEALRRAVDTAGARLEVLLDVLREEERIAMRQRREAHKVGGLVMIAVGVGMAVFLRAVDQRDPDPAYIVGIIPVLVGVALLLHAYVLSPEVTRTRSDA